MTTETFAIATQLNTEIESLEARLRDLLRLKQTRDNGYNVHLHLISDAGKTEVSIHDRELVKPIIEALIERTEQSVDKLTQEFNKL